jgi:oligosaccharide amylase
MPRDIPVSNGRVLVTFDGAYRIRDLYYPHVGQENHTAGHPFRFGVWCEGKFSWVDEAEWQKDLRYEKETLVTEVTLWRPDWQLRLVCHDAVDFHEDVYLRRIEVRNHAEREREVRLFFYHDFHIYENKLGDTAYFRPDDVSLVHYKGERYFFISCLTEHGTGWDQYACGIAETPGREGTWRDAEDGRLEGNAIAQGSTDSCGAVHLTVPPGGSVRAFYWITCGTRYPQVKTLHRIVLAKHPEELIRRTGNYWHLWVNKEDRDFADLPAEVVDLFKRSLLLIRTQIDDGGGILAANDSDIAQFGRDTYSYVWPRDGALVAAALDQAGYTDLTRPFFNFCARLVTDGGYLLHKYNPDGSLGSSWHPWVSKDPSYLPIQEDETALVLWALWKHYQQRRDVEFIKPLYRPLIVRAADFMTDYRDSTTGLPLPSYDLWEERHGVHAFTLGAIYGGLQAASRFASAFGETDHAARYQRAAGEIKAAAKRHLWRPEVGRFVRGLRVDPSGPIPDLSVDASLFGLFYFGMLDARDEQVAATMCAVKEQLWVRTGVGGLARYEGDSYQNSGDRSLPGNPWFICTLWLAQWQIAAAQRREELQPALEILRKTVLHALPSGVLAEQLEPHTGRPLSVSPLTWSHATFVAAVLEYLAKEAALRRRRA